MKNNRTVHPRCLGTLIHFLYLQVSGSYQSSQSFLWFRIAFGRNTKYTRLFLFPSLLRCPHCNSNIPTASIHNHILRCRSGLETQLNNSSSLTDSDHIYRCILNEFAIISSVFFFICSFYHNHWILIFLNYIFLLK